MYSSDDSMVDSHSGSSGASLGALALLATTGTLVCCALPLLLVSLGLGATVVAMFSAFPFLLTMSEHKIWIFAGSAILLGLTAWTIWRPGRTCPADPALAAKCEQAHRASRILLWSGVGIWGTGFAAAYLALTIRIWLDI